MNPIGYLHPYGVSGLKDAKKRGEKEWGTMCHPTEEAWGLVHPAQPIPVYLESELYAVMSSWQAQADAWRSLLKWSMDGESNADNDARRCYAQALVDGRAFEDWFDECSGRDKGYNRPPEAILMVLRPYLVGNVTA